MDSEKLATAKALFEAWWTSILDSSAVEMGVFDLDGDLYRHTETRVTFAAFVAGMVAAQPAEQASADADDHWTAWMMAELARRGASPAGLSLAAQLFGVAPCEVCGYRKMHCRCQAAPLAPSDTQGAEGLQMRINAALSAEFSDNAWRAARAQLAVKPILTAHFARQSPCVEAECWREVVRRIGWRWIAGTRLWSIDLPEPPMHGNTDENFAAFVRAEVLKSTAPKLAEAGKGE